MENEKQVEKKLRKERKYKVWELRVQIKEKDKVTVRRHAEGVEGCQLAKGSAGCVEWCYYGKDYWLIYVKCSNYPEITEVRAYPELLAKYNDTPEIWNQLETGLNKSKTKSIYDVQFLLKTQRMRKTHKLMTWFELEE